MWRNRRPVAGFADSLEAGFRGSAIAVEFALDVVPVEPRRVGLRDLPLEGMATHQRHPFVEAGGQLGGGDPAANNECVLDSPVGVEPVPDVTDAVNVGRPRRDSVAVAVANGEHAGSRPDRSDIGLQDEPTVPGRKLVTVAGFDSFDSRLNMERIELFGVDHVVSKVTEEIQRWPIRVVNRWTEFRRSILGRRKRFKPERFGANVLDVGRPKTLHFAGSCLLTEGFEQSVVGVDDRDLGGPEMAVFEQSRGEMDAVDAAADDHTFEAVGCGLRAHRAACRLLRRVVNKIFELNNNYYLSALFCY